MSREKRDGGEVRDGPGVDGCTVECEADGLKNDSHLGFRQSGMAEDPSLRQA